METTATTESVRSAKMPFQAEIKEILNLMVHSLYSQREIFLRELISNSSDALDKLRFETLSHKEWKVTDEERSIRLTPDKKARTLTIQDNGIGMTYDEVVRNIGTIAHSGTREFLKAKQEIKERPELIGQFGVGFYSAFMVASKVTLHTQHASENEGVVWESSGDGEYTISRVPRPGGHGTTIILHLKEAETDDTDAAQDFSDEWEIRRIVKKYSDFIAYPIKLKITAENQEDGDKEEVVNSQKALWLKIPSEVKEEEYKEFYRHVSHDWSDPFRTIHFKAEGTQEFAALMFVPQDVPYDYDFRDTKHGLSLYIRRVFVMSQCEDLLPRYMRFMKGLVDSSDLPLNVSREILQKDTQVERIRKALVGKILGSLRDLQTKERGEYEKFWDKFGVSIKEGLVTDFGNREKLSDLMLFRSSEQEGWTTLAEYVSRMKPEQKAIYFLTGDSLDLLKNSPYLERLKSKGYETLFLTDTVDEWLTRELTEYKDKKLVSIASDELDLDTEEEKKAREQETKEIEVRFEPLRKLVEETLKDEIKEARVSNRLVDTPACLVSMAQDASVRMARILESMGKDAPKVKRILELNPKHPIFDKMQRLPDAKKSEWIEVLYGQALINEGSPLVDPVKFSRQVSSLMLEAEVQLH